MTYSLEEGTTSKETKYLDVTIPRSDLILLNKNICNGIFDESLPNILDKSSLSYSEIRIFYLMSFYLTLQTHLEDESEITDFKERIYNVAIFCEENPYDMLIKATEKRTGPLKLEYYHFELIRTSELQEKDVKVPFEIKMDLAVMTNKMNKIQRQHRGGLKSNFRTFCCDFFNQ